MPARQVTDFFFFSKIKINKEKVKSLNGWKMREAAWRGEGIANRIEARLAYWLWLHLGPTHLFSSLSAHMPTRYPMHPLSFSYFIPFSNFPLITLTLTHPFLPLSVLPPPLLLPPSNPSFFFFLHQGSI